MTSHKASPIDKSGLLASVKPYLPTHQLPDVEDHEKHNDEDQTYDEDERAEDIREYHAEQVGEELDYVNR